MLATLLRVVPVAALLHLATADIISPHRHVQTPGVKTCAKLGGTCRVPPEDLRRYAADACPPGEALKEFDVRCDSGCGYWRGRCGQTCCVPEHAAKQEESAARKGLEEKALLGAEPSLSAKGAGVASLAWVDCFALAAVASMALVLYRCTCSQERREVNLLPAPASGRGEVE